jgi:flagella basal body P-ring formation protein FlgA
MYASGHIRRTIRLAVLLALLAFAAQLLRPNRARGDEPAQASVELGGQEKFVPGGERFYAGATLELKPEVFVIGDQVRLKSVCRWADSDKAAFGPICDLVLFRLSKQSPFRTLTVKELRDTLHEAGVNMAVVRFAGATSCTVARTDVKYDERTALEQWIATREGATTKPALIGAPATQPVNAPVPEVTRPSEARTASAIEEPSAFKTLRDYIVLELSSRLNLPVEQLQFNFNPADQKLLNLTEPHFKFNVATPRNKNLGDVTWDITIVADGVEGRQGAQKASVTANVKAWQSQVVVKTPLAVRQIIRNEDLVDRRTLADRLPEDTLVTREQVVGQMAGRELKSGTVLTARLIDATILVKSGQLVSVMLTQGSIQAKTVAKAMEQGTIGQTIRVKNEVTNNTFDVVVTGPQQAKLPAAQPKEDLATIQN